MTTVAQVVERCGLAVGYRHSSNCATSMFTPPKKRGPCDCQAMATPKKMLAALCPGDLVVLAKRLPRDDFMLVLDELNQYYWGSEDGL